MLRALRNTWRLLRMALSLARHDALFPLETLGIAPALVAWARLFARRRDARRPGERLAAALQEMGPSFIKLGQALSTRADLLSESVAADLARLQDHLPAFSGAEARRTHRSRARPADRCAVRQLRRRAGRRRLDRPGPFRRHHRRPRRRGQGAAARHREGLRARPRPLLLDGRAGRAHPAALPPAEARRFGARLRRRRAGRDGPAHGGRRRRGAGRELRRRSRLSRARHRLGPHRPARADARTGRRHSDRRPRRHRRRRPRSATSS